MLNQIDRMNRLNRKKGDWITRLPNMTKLVVFMLYLLLGVAVIIIAATIQGMI